MASQFVNNGSTMATEGANWKITTSISYNVIDPPSTIFSVSVETIVPKSCSLEQIIAIVSLNCKVKTQEAYDSYKKAIVGDWLANTGLQSYLNRVIKLDLV